MSASLWIKKISELFYSLFKGSLYSSAFKLFLVVWFLKSTVNISFSVWDSPLLPETDTVVLLWLAA